MSVIYPKFKEALGAAQINLTSASEIIKAVLIDLGTYTYNATHQYYSSASASAVGTPVTLTSKTFTNGVFDAADITFTAVSSPNTAEGILIYKEGANPGASPLICLLDAGTGLPVTPNGGDIIVTWDNGANKIFAL